MLTERTLDAELKAIITMRYSETLVETCTARSAGPSGNTAQVRTGGGVSGTVEQGLGVRTGRQFLALSAELDNRNSFG